MMSQTIKEMLSAHIAESRETMARLDERQKNMVEKVDGLASHVKTQNGRVTKIENRQYWYAGAAAALAIFIKEVWHKIT